MTTVQLYGSEQFDTQMISHTATKNNNVRLALEFLKHLSNVSNRHGTLDNGKHKKFQVKKSGQT